MTSIKAYQPILNWIASQQDDMLTLLKQWAEINSGTDNVIGLSRMAEYLTHAFLSLDTEIQQLTLPSRSIINSNGGRITSLLGDALRLQKHPKAPIKVLLNGHMDTVYPFDSPFQKVEQIKPNVLRGPGVADMKGGLVILLMALRALERSPWAGQIGWEVLLNPDEEIGSPGSHYLFTEAAQRNHLGLLFEPSFPDGSFVSSRKGSYSFTIIAHGRSAHVGRDFQMGRNAITYLSRFFLRAEELNDLEKGNTINLGFVTGGGPVNVVPDFALGKINVRSQNNKDLELIHGKFNEIIADINQNEGVTLTLHQDHHTPPKPFDTPVEQLFHAFRDCATDLGQPMQWKPSGGASDGSRLHQEGLRNIDTLGVIGGAIHTPDEYMFMDSLTSRAQLTALFLMKLAAGEIQPFPPKEDISTTEITENTERRTYDI